MPRDLRGAGPTRAHADPLGELWHADVLELLARIPDRSVDLVVTDPPYAIAKQDWDEFESLDAYVEWCDVWLAEIARVLAPHGSAYVCGFSEILADVKVRSARPARRRSVGRLGHDRRRRRPSRPALARGRRRCALRRPRARAPDALTAQQCVTAPARRALRAAPRGLPATAGCAA